MKVLSLFDGMSCGMIAFKGLGINVEQYTAYEIEKYAVETSLYNFPEIEQKGDVFSADFNQYKGVDYLVGGSPCTYWSIAQTKNRETVASGMGWELFSQYVRALHEAQPKYFLYENNKSMSAAIRASITETFGFEPVLINSALVSAQNRQRLYWCGIRQEDGTYKKAVIEQPEDRKILLKDILETTINNSLSEKEMSYMLRDHQDQRWTFCNKPAQEDKSKCLVANLCKGVPYNVLAEKIAEPVNITEEGKSHTLKAQYYKNGMANFVTNGGFAATGVAEPICLNSKSGRGGIAGLQPSLQDRVYDINGKMPAVTTSFNPKIAEPLRVKEATKKGYTDIQAGNCVDMSMPNSKTRRGRNMEIKSNCMQTSNEFYQYCGTLEAPVYEVKDGNIIVKDKKYPIKLIDGFYIIRKLTVTECMRLQTVPDWYKWPVSKSQAYKMLGNGWTVEVIKHLIRSTLQNEKH